MPKRVPVRASEHTTFALANRSLPHKRIHHFRASGYITFASANTSLKKETFYANA